jgi:hypothetical protein
MRWHYCDKPRYVDGGRNVRRPQHPRTHCRELTSVALAMACVLLACGGPSQAPEAPARSEAAPSASASSAGVRAASSESAAISTGSAPPVNVERKGPCSIRVAAHVFADVPNTALIDAALPRARAATGDPTGREIALAKGSGWSDCHGRPSIAGVDTALGPLSARVPSRLVVDDRHGYAWIEISGAGALLVRFRVDGDTLTATATEPEIGIPIQPLRSGRIGDFEMVFGVLDRTVMELDVHPSGNVEAEAWRAYVTHGDEDFSGHGMIFTRYADSKWKMAAHDDWKVADDAVIVREIWLPPGGRDHIDMTRRYTMHGHDLVPTSTAVPH